MHAHFDVEYCSEALLETEQMPWSTHVTATGRLNSSALTQCSMEALEVRSWSLMCRWSRHFQTGVYLVAIISAVCILLYERSINLIVAMCTRLLLSAALIRRDSGQVVTRWGMRHQ